MYNLPPLPYDYTALEPHLDEQTMKLHHDKHHQAYVDNLNKALEGHPELQNMHGTELMDKLNTIPQDIRTKVRNNLGGHLNHSLFWQIMTPEPGSQKPEAKYAVITKITDTFGSLEKFQEQLTAAGLGRFGSGWAWLVVDTDGKLQIADTPNQDSPLMMDQEPILGVDVWEHAYYLKYQNRRKDYIDAWWHIVNWKEVEDRYTAALH